MQSAEGRRREEADQARRLLHGRLAEQVTHDVANHLAVTRLVAESLARRADLDPDVAAQVARVVAGAAAAGGLLQQLAAVSGRRPGPPHPLDLASLVGDLHDLLLAAVGRRGLDVVAEAALVVADRGEVEDLLLLLVLGGPHDVAAGAVSLEVGTAGSGPHLAVVRPSGELPAADLELAAALAGAAGAVLDVDDRGGTLRVTVRFVAGEQAGPAPARHDGAAGAGAVVLVVEDDPDLRALVESALAAEGYDVDSVADAGAALGHPSVVDGRLRLLITDVELPGMSGLELAEQLASPEVRVVVMSGRRTDELTSALPASAIVLEKPFGVPELRQQVRRALG